MKTTKSNFKRVTEYVGGEVAGYELETSYKFGNWRIHKDGSDWNVYRFDFYGSFKTLKEAKRYVDYWLTINPKDL